MYILPLFELLHLDETLYAHWRDVQRCIMRNNKYHTVMLESLKVRQGLFVPILIIRIVYLIFFLFEIIFI